MDNKELEFELLTNKEDKRNKLITLTPKDKAYATYTYNDIRLYTISEISKIFLALGMSVCKSYADYTGKPSSDHDIQLMVYSVRG